MSRRVMARSMFAGFCIITPLALVAFGDQTAPREKTTPSTAPPVLTMKHTAGWGAGVLANFTLEKNGTFHWQSKKGKVTGSIPSEKTKQLIKEVSSAGAGPGAEDAGYVEFKWVDDSGKKRSQDYSYPRKAPCQRLLKKIEDLVGKYRNPSAEQGSGTARR